MEDRTWNMNIKKRNAVGFLDAVVFYDVYSKPEKD